LAVRCYFSPRTWTWEDSRKDLDSFINQPAWPRDWRKKDSWEFVFLFLLRIYPMVIILAAKMTMWFKIHFYFSFLTNCTPNRLRQMFGNIRI
jgi:hypothetical protein